MKTLRDGAVVVASILIAFGLEAWWAERQLAQDLRSDLSSVQEELIQVNQTVQNLAGRSARIVAAGNGLLERLSDGRDLALISVPDTLPFWAIRASPTLDVSIGAVEALIASGRFGAITNAELRGALASVRAQIQDVAEDQATARDYGLSVLGPRLDGVLDHSRFTLFQTAPDFPFVRRPTATFGSMEFPNTLEIRNGINVRTGYFLRSVDAMAILVETVDHILELLEEEAGGGPAAVAQ